MTLAQAVNMILRQTNNRICVTDYSGNVCAHYDNGERINFYNETRQSKYMNAHVNNIVFSHGHAHVYIDFSESDMWG